MPRSSRATGLTQVLVCWLLAVASGCGPSSEERRFKGISAEERAQIEQHLQNAGVDQVAGAAMDYPDHWFVALESIPTGDAASTSSPSNAVRHVKVYKADGRVVDAFTDSPIGTSAQP